MDPECAQLLPHVCAILVDKSLLVSDDSIFQKLQDWFKSLAKTVQVDQLLEENQCIVGILERVLNMEYKDNNLYAFTMRLTGILAASEEGFEFLQRKNIVEDYFGAFTLTSLIWENINVKMAWIDGLLDMIQHKIALHFLQTIGGMQVMINLQKDSSMFVACAANNLMAHAFITSTKIDGEPGMANITDLSDNACLLLSHLVQSLSSGCPSITSQAMKTLAVIFKGCTDVLAEIVWWDIMNSINSLLDQNPVRNVVNLEEMLLTAIRIPVFQNPNCNLWVTVKKALKNMHMTQSISLAAEILKLGNCPQDVNLQAMSVFLYPFHYILKRSATHCEHPGVENNPLYEPVDAEYVMAMKSSCIPVLGLCLRQVRELCEMNSIKVEMPHRPVLNSIVTLLQFCIGQAASELSSGLSFSKKMIGCLRVQKAALDAIQALSHWTMNKESLEQTYNVLFAYLENSGSDVTIIKKTLQALLKWLRVSSEPEHNESWEHSIIFLNTLWPLIVKRLCSPNWEHRDTMLEFAAELVDTLQDQESFKQAISASGVPQLVLDLLKDPESYVRSSAVSCLGRLVTIDNLHLRLEDAMSTETLKREILVPNFLNILSEDTDAFPRRAVMKVFVEWQKLDYIQTFHEPEKLLFRILHVAKEDCDWEVKVNALELANIFVDKTFETRVANSCPYTVGLPTNTRVSGISEMVKRCDQVGLFPCLLDALCDCDRMVALKACEILLSLKSKLDGKDTCSSNSELNGIEWLEGNLRNWRLQSQHGALTLDAQDKTWARDILNKIDLVSIESSLSMGSSYSDQTPQSLLQDIQTALWGGDEQDADCY
ncbi:BRCA1-associated ATM activator 1 isoform X1 [Pelobates cultripes]|uniref:BRCA1-associated ATM activator 1 isoform X1 n=1 Tax=Pelobates cultripes TaxID=61616 RepID=A0AAD1WIB1_PELCU|nr:BRCA1-associated ATM activator 1 isoform X1 [Pelobates cultripes]